MRRSLLSLPLLLVTLTCGDDGMSPPAVASIALTSPIGARLAVGRSVQLAAEARDGSGNAMSGATVTFSATSTGIVTVTTAGLVLGVAPGIASVVATSGSVTQQLSLQVIAADLAAVTATCEEPYSLVLVTNLTTAVRTRVQAALQQCVSGGASGNFAVIEAYPTGVQAEFSAANLDPTDRALLASLALYTDRVTRLLNPAP